MHTLRVESRSSSATVSRQLGGGVNALGGGVWSALENVLGGGDNKQDEAPPGVSVVNTGAAVVEPVTIAPAARGTRGRAMNEAPVQLLGPVLMAFLVLWWIDCGLILWKVVPWIVHGRF